MLLHISTTGIFKLFINVICFFSKLPLNAQVSDSQNKTPVEKNLIPKAMEKYDTSSYEAADSNTWTELAKKETQPKPCKNIYCSNEGEGTQTEGYESHPDSVEHREHGTIQGELKAKEKKRSELISLSCDAEMNQNSSMESNANMHGPSAEVSDHIINKLKCIYVLSIYNSKAVCINIIRNSTAI